MIDIVRNIEDMRRWSGERRSEGVRIGLVPTMGALHEGHLSLVRRALALSDRVVVSVFVNPTQFGAGEDLERYPHDLEGDTQKLESLGAHVIFSPDSAAMYPAGYSTYVTVEKLTEGLCGRSRPVHFRGVTTVVSKLFTIVMPHVAVFGQKDAQQLAVIRRMTRDLNLDVKIEACPIIREPDSLAMSSRNSYLSEEERRQAPLIYRALCAGEELAQSGKTVSADIIARVREVLSEVPLAETEYVEVVDADEMTPVEEIPGTALLAVAVRFGSTRLIDNVVLNTGDLLERKGQ